MNHDQPSKTPRGTTLPVLALLVWLASCTSRTLTVASEPPGAEVLINRERVGFTPVTVDFTYGGLNEIILLKPRFLPAVVRHDTERFVLDTPPFDIFTHLGGLHEDDHQLIEVRLVEDRTGQLYALDPLTFVENLRERAESLRARSVELSLEARPVIPLYPETPPPTERDKTSPPKKEEVP